MAHWLARKPMDALLQEAAEQGQHTLKRTLGTLDLIALGIGATIGAGIFVITGSAAAQYAGPSIVLSFVAAGIVCALAGLCYAEFASLVPIAGSAYTYSYAALGEIFAWIIGWDLVLEYAFSTATVASGWSANVVSLLQDFGVPVPPAIANTPGTRLFFHQGRWEARAVLEAAGIPPDSLPQATAVFNLPGFLAILAVTTILVLGIRESANLNTAMVILKVGTVLTFIGVAAAFLWDHPSIAAANWRPFLPDNSGEFGRFGWSGVGRGAAVVFFAFIGFDSVSTAAQEAKQPQRAMPAGLLVSLAICTVLYILVALLLTGVTHYSRLNVAAPVALAIDATGAKWGSLLVKLGTVMGLSTTMLVTLLGQSRVFYSMSRDGLLPPWAGRVHPRFLTPWISSLVVGLCVALCAALVPIETLGQLVSIGTLLAFTIVCAAVWILRRTHPGLPRPFRAPLVPLVPILGMISSLTLMATLPIETWMRLLVWLAIGMVIYLAYGRHHSRLGVRCEV
ncbi:MAG: amino acid permease [Acidobacteria bacterium]|nr:amino acid permease [Acidobacteriota bacterium]